jgi:hypothetical protein
MRSFVDRVIENVVSRKDPNESEPNQQREHYCGQRPPARQWRRTGWRGRVLFLISERDWVHEV